MEIKQANFLTEAEFCRGPDLLRPGSLTGKSVDQDAIAFVYSLHPCAGDDPDIHVSEHDPCFIWWPAEIGHERITEKEVVLKAMFGPDYPEATKEAAYEQPIYEMGDQGGLIVIGKKLAYDAIELRRLTVKRNLLGRYGEVRGVPCLMLWNRCHDWLVMLDKLLILLNVPDDGLITLGRTNQWWMRDYRYLGRSLFHGLDD